MSDEPRDYDTDLANIMNALAESTLDTPLDEIESEIREDGKDPNAVAERVKQVIFDVVKGCQRQPLLEAKARYEERVAALRSKNYEIPDSPDEQRKMISTLLAAKPQLSSGLLTAQFRDFTELVDEDVGGYLKQLLELIDADVSSDSEENKR